MTSLLVQHPEIVMSQPSSTPHGVEGASAARYPGHRFAQIVKLKPEHVEKYKEIHAAVWPEVLNQIKDCNIQDCRLLLTLTT